MIPASQAGGGGTLDRDHRAFPSVRSRQKLIRPRSRSFQAHRGIGAQAQTIAAAFFLKAAPRHPALAADPED